MHSRRGFLQTAGLTAAGLCSGAAQAAGAAEPLEEFGYGDVSLAPGPAQAQFEQTQAVLMGLNEDSLLKPWRLRAGLPAPGPEMGGWYDELPLVKTESGGHGFAPAHCFGQWMSALARGYAVSGDPGTQAKLKRLLAGYGPAISGKFYTNFRFPAYNYDKLVLGLVDAERYGGLREARGLLERTTDAAAPHLPPRALDRDEPQRRWRKQTGESTTDDYTWDESYTSAENLYIAWRNGNGERYRELARNYLLDETFFNPLSEGKNVLGGHHAYSFCNALSGAMQAYLVDGSAKHLRAAKNAFDMIAATQSFATGGWGPNESFSAPGGGTLFKSLTETHRGFETPCGSYAHFKLTRYLLRVTRDGRYGDSMERVLYNTVLGAKPIEGDGQAFYYSDYNNEGKKTYFGDAWPCCSGTLPQVAADYRILTYFRDAGGVTVNLYLPSTLKWVSAEGSQMELVQSGEYPFEGKISFLLRASRAAKLSLRLRIPEWAGEAGTSIRVNGKRADAAVRDGFAALERQWKDGDRIELELPLPLRLEAIEPGHPETVALLRGPLVLFGIGAAVPVVTRAELLAPVRAGAAEWRVNGSGGQVTLRPFTGIRNETYRTYFRIG